MRNARDKNPARDCQQDLLFMAQDPQDSAARFGLLYACFSVGCLVFSGNWYVFSQKRLGIGEILGPRKIALSHIAGSVAVCRPGKFSSAGKFRSAALMTVSGNTRSGLKNIFERPVPSPQHRMPLFDDEAGMVGGSAAESGTRPVDSVCPPACTKGKSSRKPAYVRTPQQSVVMRRLRRPNGDTIAETMRAMPGFRDHNSGTVSANRPLSVLRS